MKILALIAEFASSFGDGIHEREIIRRLCYTDNVTVVTLFKGNSDIERFGFRLYFFPFLRPAIFFNIFWGFFVGVVLVMLSLIKGKIFDAIYVRDISFAVGLNILKKFHKIPTVLKTVMFYSDEYFLKRKGILNTLLSKIVCLVERTAVLNSDKIIVPSFLFKAELTKRYAVDPDAVSVLSVGVDTKTFSPDKVIVSEDGNYNIGYIGSLHGGNDVETLLQSISLLKAKIPNIHLFLAVNNDPQFLKKMIQEYGIESIVIIKTIPHKEVPSFLSALDVVVIPRRSITCTELVMPLKLLEAGAAKKPVVISETKVIGATLRDGENVLLCHAEDAEDLAAKLLLLHNDGEYRAKLANGLYTFCKSYDWQIIIKKLRAELCSLACTKHKV